MSVIMRQTEDKDWFQIDLGSYPKHEIHYNRLDMYCTPELIASLDEGKEVECIIVSKEMWKKYMVTIAGILKERDG